MFRFGYSCYVGLVGLATVWKQSDYKGVSIYVLSIIKRITFRSLNLILKLLNYSAICLPQKLP